MEAEIYDLRVRRTRVRPHHYRAAQIILRAVLLAVGVSLGLYGVSQHLSPTAPTTQE